MRKSVANMQRTAIRLIGLDMDGTLLNSRREISDANKIAIKQAQANGVVVAVVTGRAYEEALRPIKRAGITCPMLCMNGAEMRSETGEILASIPIPLQLYDQINTVLLQEDLYFELYTSLGIFTNDQKRAIQADIFYLQDINPGIDERLIRMEVEDRFKRREIEEIANYRELLESPNIYLYKIMAYSRSLEQLNGASEILRKIEAGKLAVSSSAPSNIELTMYEAQKGIALLKLADLYGISQGNVMAMGDNFNDLSMLSVVGFPVAMGNAEQEIKDICKFVTMDNDEDGVAYAIEKFILQAIE